MNASDDESRAAEVAMIQRIEEAARRGVSEVIEQHRRDGDPIVVYQNGKVTWIPADKIPEYVKANENADPTQCNSTPSI